MTVALYRRFRPDTFADVIGQEHVTDLLKNALDSGRASHAYLFSGPRGCGKTTSARIMARCLNCAEGPTSTPCGVCESCVELAAGGPGSLDVVEIDAASNSGVDDARELRERAGFAPTRDRYKIFILDEAHMVTKGGFNALLKLVEEPPEHAKFIFATTEPEKVIGTIRSRTHHYPFRLVAPTVLQAYLAEVCAREEIVVEEGVLPLVVAAGGGSVRDSLSVLDQLIAGSTGQQLVLSQAIDLLGFTDTALLDKMMDALGANDGAAVFQVIDEMAESGQDPRRFTEDLLQRMRNVLICAVAAPQAAAIMPHIPEDQLARMFAQAEVWGSRLLSRRADLIDEALRFMGGATSPRLQVELLMGRLLLSAGESAAPIPVTTGLPSQAPPTRPVVPSPRPTASVSAPAERTPAAPTTRPKATSRKPAEAAAMSPEPQPPPPASTQVAASETPQADLDSAKNRWQEVLDAAGKLSRVSGALLRNVDVSGVDGTKLVLTTSESLAQRFKLGLADFDNLQRAVQQIFGADWSASISAGPAPETARDQPVSSQSQTERKSSATGRASHAPAANDGWGPVAVPGAASPQVPQPVPEVPTTPESEASGHPKVTPEVQPTALAAGPQIGDSATPAQTPVPKPVNGTAQDNGGSVVSASTVDAPHDEPEPPDDWGEGVSWEDATIDSLASPSLPLLLETLGGTVIETIKGDRSR